MFAARSLTTLVVLGLILAFATAGFTPAVALAVNANAADDVTLALDADSYSATRGALVPLTVTLDKGGQAALTVSGPADLYESTAVLVDANGDGRISLAFDSYRAARGDERRAYRVSPDDRLERVTRTTKARANPLPAGRYQVVATTGIEWDGAQLRLHPFSFGSATVSTLPRTAFDDHSDDDLPPLDALVVQSTPATTVARDDWLVLQFEAPGTSGLLTDSHPATNLVAATPSTPGVQSTHTVRASVTEAGALQTLVMDYDGSAADRPRPLTSGLAVTLVAVDHDGDGYVDERLDEHLVSVVSHSEGRYRFQFDEQYDLTAGDVLVVAYDLVNPEMAGRDTLTVRINDAPVQRGVVAYGLAGSGSLGNGLDLALVATGGDDGDEVSPVSLAGAHTSVDPQTGILSVVVPTDGLAANAPVDYRATLRLTGQSPYAGDVTGESSTATFTVVPRTATIDGAGDGLVAEPARETFSGTTTLAPGSRIAVSASQFDEPGSFIQVRLATVADDGTWNATFDFRGVENGSTAQLAVYDWERGQPVPAAALTAEPVAVTIVASEAET